MIDRGVILMLAVALTSSCTNSSSLLNFQAHSSQASARAKSQSNSAALEKQIAREIARERRARGLKPMTYDPRVAKIARTHSAKLAHKSELSGAHKINHDGFSKRFNKVVLNLGMKKMGENVAYMGNGATKRAARFTSMWMESDGHKKNILKEWNYTGVGVSIATDGAVYATQLFALKTDFTF